MVGLLEKNACWVSKYQPTSLYKWYLYTTVLPGCCSSLLKPMRGPLPSTSVTSINRISLLGVSILDLTLWWRSGLPSVQKHLSGAQIYQASVIPSISMFDKRSGSQTAGEVSETQRNQSKRCTGPDGCKKKTSSLALQQPANTLSNRAISPPASGPPSSNRLPAPPALRNGSHQHTDDSIPLLLGQATQLVSVRLNNNNNNLAG